LHLLIENQVHPLLIGHAERTVSQIRELASLLIESNCSGSAEEILDYFLEPNRHHNFRFYRDEVKNAGLHVVTPNRAEEKLILSIFEDIADELDLNNHEDKRGTVKALIQSTAKGKTLCVNTKEYEGWSDEKDIFTRAKLSS
jgi:hypothetical protein